MKIELSPEAVYHLGLAVEQGCTEEQQRRSYGDELVDTISAAQATPEFQTWYKEFVKKHIHLRDLQS